MNEYRVVRLKHGIAVYGAMPVADMVALGEAFSEQGHTLICAGLANNIGADFVFASKEGADAWRADLEAGASHLPPLDRWLKSGQTGISSLTIAQVLSGRPLLRNWSPNTPQDPSDFRRCLLLLEAIPEYEARLGEVGEKHPKWKPFVEAWTELVTLYLEEEAEGTGRMPRLYARLQDLEGG